MTNVKVSAKCPQCCSFSFYFVQCLTTEAGCDPGCDWALSPVL